MLLWTIAALLLGICCGNSIRSAIEIGSDEHYEVTKGLLWARGYGIYTDFWNDQPPLFTVLLGTLFKCFGPNMLLARALGIGFGLSLLTVMFCLVSRDYGVIPAWIAVTFLTTAPHVLELLVSCMLEVPALGTGLWSLWLIRRWGETGKTRFIAASAVVFAVALQVKLTAAILLPALTVELVFVRRELSNHSRVAKLVLWSVTLFTGFITLGVIFGHGYKQAWLSHRPSTAPTNFLEISQYSFSPGVFLDHPEGLLAIAMSLWFVLWKRRVKVPMFPLVLLMSVVPIHLLHRPYWPMYYVHFAVPLAYLIAYVLRAAFASEMKVMASWAQSLAASALISALAVFGGWRLASEIRGIRGLPTIDNDSLLTVMRAHAKETKWVYTLDTIYAFHARVLVIPNLAVIPKKRLWANQVTENDIELAFTRYHPEQVLLSNHDTVFPRLATILNESYGLIYEDERRTLYLRRQTER